MNNPNPVSPSSSSPPSIFLDACRSQSATRLPVWFPLTRPGTQNQAEQQPSPEIFHSPHAIQQATLDLISSLNPDAVLLSSDGMLPLQGMGIQLEPARSMRLQAASSLRSPRDIDLLATPPAEEHLAPILSVIPSLQQKCRARGLPLVGWARAPLSLASNAIDGVQSSSSENTRALLYQHPAAWKRLMEKLVTVTADFLLHQVQSGVEAVLVHDPVSGTMLSPEDYRRHILPHLSELFEKLENLEAPVLYHSALQQPLLEKVSGMVDVISLDHRAPLKTVLQGLDPAQPVQITLDPVLFSAPWREVKAHLDSFLDEAAGRSGTLLGVFDPGVGDPSRRNLLRVVEYIHRQSGPEFTTSPGPISETRGGKV